MAYGRRVSLQKRFKPKRYQRYKKYSRRYNSRKVYRPKYISKKRFIQNLIKRRYK